MKKVFNYAIKVCILIFLFSAFLIFSAFWYFSYGLPDYKKLSNYEPSVLSRVYAESGELIGEFAIEKRLFIPFNSIPDKVINSFLSAEDKNFFKHPGIDAKGVMRAIINNFKNYLKSNRLEGASTITQQVAKNFLLSNEITFKRKFKEAILAFRIERALSKERIMELYLNQIYLGEGTYGIAAASLEYFDKSISKLEFEEAALLAALPKAPSKYNPFKSPKLAIERRNIVITRSLIENVECFRSIDEALKTCNGDIWFIGGAGIYEEAMDLADCIDMTLVPDNIIGNNCIYFPKIGNEWEKKDEKPLEKSSKLLHKIYTRRV